MTLPNVAGRTYREVFRDLPNSQTQHTSLEIFKLLTTCEAVISKEAEALAQTFREKWQAATTSKGRKEAFQFMHAEYKKEKQEANAKLDPHEAYVLKVRGYEKVSMAIASMFDEISHYKKDTAQLLFRKTKYLGTDEKLTTRVRLLRNLGSTNSKETRELVVHYMRDKLRAMRGLSKLSEDIKPSRHTQISLHSHVLGAELIRSLPALGRYGDTGKVDRSTQQYMLNKAWNSTCEGILKHEIHITAFKKKEDPPPKSVIWATIQVLPQLSKLPSTLPHRDVKMGLLGGGPLGLATTYLGAKAAGQDESPFDRARGFLLRTMGPSNDMNPNESAFEYMEETHEDWQLMWETMSADSSDTDKICFTGDQAHFIRRYRNMVDSYPCHATMKFDENFKTGYKGLIEKLAVPEHCKDTFIGVLKNCLDRYADGNLPEWNHKTAIWAAHKVLDALPQDKSIADKETQETTELMYRLVKKLPKPDDLPRRSLAPDSEIYIYQARCTEFDTKLDRILPNDPLGV